MSEKPRDDRSTHGDPHPVPELSPFAEHLGDNLFLNKFNLWHHPQLTEQLEVQTGDSCPWQWPEAARHDPEG